jgi:hypothetical protein
MPGNPRKSGFSKFGYGALALYASLVAVMMLGVYGVNLTSIIMDQSRSDRARAQLKTGRMLVRSADRMQCRSIRFDNETAELSRETLVDCSDLESGGSFGFFRNGFMNR